MKYFYLLLVVSFSLFYGCEGKMNSQEEDFQELIEWYDSILVMAQNENCTDAANWGITAIGAKACGGPTGYIAYSLNIDIENFLNEVADYTAAQNAFNIKWGSTSDCMVPLMPTGIDCINGDLHFTY